MLKEKKNSHLKLKKKRGGEGVWGEKYSLQWTSNINILLKYNTFEYTWVVVMVKVRMKQNKLSGEFCWLWRESYSIKIHVKLL